MNACGYRQNNVRSNKRMATEERERDQVLGGHRGLQEEDELAPWTEGLLQAFQGG